MYLWCLAGPVGHFLPVNNSTLHIGSHVALLSYPLAVCKEVASYEDELTPCKPLAPSLTEGMVSVKAPALGFAMADYPAGEFH